MQIAPGSVKVYKGKVSDVESYSCFWDNNKANESCLNSELRKRDVTDVYICGIAADVCVGASTLSQVNSISLFCFSPQVLRVIFLLFDWFQAIFVTRGLKKFNNTIVHRIFLCSSISLYDFFFVNFSSCYFPLETLLRFFPILFQLADLLGTVGRTSNRHFNLLTEKAASMPFRSLWLQLKRLSDLE